MISYIVQISTDLAGINMGVFIYQSNILGLKRRGAGSGEGSHAFPMGVGAFVGCTVRGPGRPVHSQSYTVIDSSK